MITKTTTANTEALHIVAIDPSCDITGVAIVATTRDGRIVSVAAAAFDAFELLEMPRSRSDKTSRVLRIAATRRALAVWLAGQVCGFDLVAYESETGRGHQATQALGWSVGNYLTARPVLGLPVTEVSRQASCIAVGAGSVYREAKGKTATEALAKRRRLKIAVVHGVNHACAHLDGWVNLTDEQDAIADAVAVGIVAGMTAWREIIKAEEKKAQKKLRLAGEPPASRAQPSV